MRSLGLAAALAALVAVAAQAVDQGPAGARDAVRRTLDKAGAVVRTDQAKDQKLAALRELARELLDTREMGRRALGETLRAQPAAQQEDFLDLFDELMVRSYLQKLLFFRQPRFAFGDAEPGPEGVVVRTRIVTDKDDFLVDYTMRQRDGTWLASDVVIERISLTRNYAQQFQEILRSRSFPELLELMRVRVAGLRARAPS
jgi:phospholipid transport system substrate-binding protein